MRTSSQVRRVHLPKKMRRVRLRNSRIFAKAWRQERVRLMQQPAHEVVTTSDGTRHVVLYPVWTEEFVAVDGSPLGGRGPAMTVPEEVWRKVHVANPRPLSRMARGKLPVRRNRRK